MSASAKVVELRSAHVRDAAQCAYAVDSREQCRILLASDLLAAILNQQLRKMQTSVHSERERQSRGIARGSRWRSRTERTRSSLASSAGMRTPESHRPRFSASSYEKPSKLTVSASGKVVQNRTPPFASAGFRRQASTHREQAPEQVAPVGPLRNDFVSAKKCKQAHTVSASAKVVELRAAHVRDAAQCAYAVDSSEQCRILLASDLLAAILSQQLRKNANKRTQ